MIEIFTTNVETEEAAKLLITLIHQEFKGCSATFDIEDCDHILRVECDNGDIKTNTLIAFLAYHNCQATVLQDDPVPVRTLLFV